MQVCAEQDFQLAVMYANAKKKNCRDAAHLPDGVNSQPGTYEENCKHCKQEVAQYLTLGVVGHLGSLK